MPIFDFYSSRKAAGEQGADVWVYDQVSDKLRVRVSNIVKDALGTTREYANNSRGVYEMISNAVAHEHGRGEYLFGHDDGGWYNVHECLRAEPNIDVWLDLVQLCFRSIERLFGQLDQYGRAMREIQIAAKDAVAELNERFRRAGFGFRYESGQIFRVNSEFMHQQATVPALRLLSDARFTGAEQEFRAAHDHLKAGEFKDCAVDALNALESTIKAICDAKDWTYQKGARATDLLKVLRKEKLFPEFADLSFEQLIATMKSGLPVVRNETGGHGQGAKPWDTRVRCPLCPEPRRFEDPISL